MSTVASSPPRRVNVRTPEVMERVQAQVEKHYRSRLVESIRAKGGMLTIGNTSVRLARQFGFCYGVERAIDLAYAARKVFAGKRIFLLGEIIHNPEVNRQLADMGIITLRGREVNETLTTSTPEDVVIVPAFGSETHVMKLLKERGVHIVDTTCGDVMSVWKRVKAYARDGFTSIIHGKAVHEETSATSSRAMGDTGSGQYLVILTLADCDAVCDYIRQGGNREVFLRRFAGAHSEGFDPDVHLRRIGVANQTTMLKSETEELQRRLQQAVQDRDGSTANFQSFDTICGATQERQDSLFELLKESMDLLLVVGGYNSSNTTHLVEIGQEHLPTFFIRDASCLSDFENIIHYDLEHKSERTTYVDKFNSAEPVLVGVTAGASCPNNLIEDTIIRIFELRGVPREQVLAA